MTSGSQDVPAPDHGQRGARQDGGYGTGAHGPGRSFGQGRPEEVDTLKTVAVASLVLAVIAQLVSFLNGRTDAYQQDMTEYLTQLGLGQEIAQQTASGGGPGAGLGLVFGLAILIGLYLLVINGLVRRRNRARVLGIVFAMVSVGGGIGGLLLGMFFDVPLVVGGLLGLLSLLLSLALLVVNVYWLVLAFQRGVAAWYRGYLPS